MNHSDESISGISSVPEGTIAAPEETPEAVTQEVQTADTARKSKTGWTTWRRS